MRRALGRGMLAAAMVAAVGGLTGLTAPAASAATTPVGPTRTSPSRSETTSPEAPTTSSSSRCTPGATPDGTPIYIYVPSAGTSTAAPASSASTRTSTPTPTTTNTPCGGDLADHLMTQASITQLGDELANHVVAIDEAHFGDIGDANGAEPGGDALVALFYNVFDDAYYDCDGDVLHRRLLRPGVRAGLRAQRHRPRHQRLRGDDRQPGDRDRPHQRGSDRARAAAPASRLQRRQ